MGILDTNSLCQISLVVEDIEQAAKYYAELFGVALPPIEECPPEEIAHTQFLGEPTPTRAKLCNFQLGQIVLELTQCDEHPSTWKDFLQRRGQGVHHIGFITDKRDDVVDYLEKRDMPVRHYGEYPGGNYTVIDSEKQLGIYLNIKHEKA